MTKWFKKNDTEAGTKEDSKSKSVEDGIYVIVSKSGDGYTTPVKMYSESSYYPRAKVFTNYEEAVQAAKTYLATASELEVHILSLETTINKQLSYTTHRNI